MASRLLNFRLKINRIPTRLFSDKKKAPAPFVYSDLFDLHATHNPPTPYRKLTGDFVKTLNVNINNHFVFFGFEEKILCYVINEYF